MSNFLSQIRKAHADYSTKFDRFQSGINRAHKRFKAIAHAALHRELTRRFKLGHWCICWSQCRHNGEVTDALDLSDDKIVVIHAAPDEKRFPKIDSFTTWSYAFCWYLLKEHDIIIAWNSEGTSMMLVFAPEQIHLVETFLSEKQYDLYKSCL